MSGAFASSQELATFIGTEIGTDSVPRAQMFLRQASHVIRGFCDQELSKVEADVVTFQDTDRDFLLLPERPVISIGSVVVDAVTLATSAYRVERWGALYTTSGADWSSGATVTYTHGFVEGDPEFDAIRTVTLEMAARAFTGDRGQESEVFGPPAEARGWAPSVFLTGEEKARLASFGPVLVG